MNIYVGYDPKYSKVFEACTNSIFRNTDSPSFYTVTPLDQQKLRDSKVYWREEDDRASTPFSLTRFLVPLLNGYSGWALYCDSDFIFLDDVSNLLALKDDSKAVMVVQHNYEPKPGFKMNRKVNHTYRRKNWSSLMLFNCSHIACKGLIPEIVNGLDPADLHQLAWCDEHEIGKLPTKWNHLVGYYDDPSPSAIHFTDGGPWLLGYDNEPFAEIWNDYV